jgi:hypothetical protein
VPFPVPAPGKKPEKSLASWYEQDNLLREMWLRNDTPEAIAAALQRSVPSIMTRAARLGLPRRFAPGRKSRALLRMTGALPAKNTQSIKSRTEPPAEMRSAAEEKTRVCLMCLTTFASAGRHNRICLDCKDSREYSSACRLPDIIMDAN